MVGLGFLVLLQPLCNTCGQDKSKHLVTIEVLYHLKLKEILQEQVSYSNRPFKRFLSPVFKTTPGECSISQRKRQNGS